MTNAQQDNELQFCESCNCMTPGNPTCGKCGAWRETEAMTPTEQDKELRDKISHRFASVCAEGHQQSCGEYQTAVDEIMQLIAADRKRVALEARIDELERVYPQLQKHRGVSGEGNYYYDDRIAELKAQQEELGDS